MQITASFLSHISGEKRFQTIQDLVADGLIIMYIDMYAKDYVDTMMISPAVKAGEEKNLDTDETKEKEPLDQPDAMGKDQVFSTTKISQAFVIYYFPCLLCSLYPPCLLRVNYGRSGNQSQIFAHHFRYVYTVFAFRINHAKVEFL